MDRAKEGKFMPSGIDYSELKLFRRRKSGSGEFKNEYFEIILLTAYGSHCYDINHIVKGDDCEIEFTIDGVKYTKKENNNYICRLRIERVVFIHGNIYDESYMYRVADKPLGRWKPEK